MSNTCATDGTLALAIDEKRPHLSVINAAPKRRVSLYSDICIFVFGFLHGFDFSSQVHDVLEERRHYRFFTSPKERVFGTAVAALATSALFFLSFV